ncbi:MAG: GTPase Obg [Parcubacteria group bacterium]|nr:GTPase Obg [Parcubacteria group bacterium]
MAFIDEVTIHAKAGKGGDGVVRWLHMKGLEKGGPAGGDGGRGGDVVVEGVRDLGALATYQFSKKFNAENGFPGENNNKHGADGQGVTLKVPVGTLVKNGTTKETFEVLEEGQRIVVFKGGNGGLGNPYFKGATNQNPEQSTPGKIGGSGEIHFTLKIIADVGLVGFPNAGKSSLLNSLTRARSKVGAYPFTTLDPHLGDLYGYLIADIPGLISGASSGRGLGSKFLRHIERTVLIAHLVSAEQEDLAQSYRDIRTELESFGKDLAGKREIVVLSKVDLLTPEELAEKLALLKEVSGKPVYALSIIDEDLLKAFSDNLVQELRASKEPAITEAS